MIHFILKRILWLIPILFVITILTFALTNLSAGDPASIVTRLETGSVSEESLGIVRAELGLNQSLPEQYFTWLKGVAKFDFGTSFKTKRPVSDELFSKLPATAKLTLCALLILTVVSLILGVLSALYPGSVLDKLAKALSFGTVSIPPFLIGLLLLYIFGVKIKLVNIISYSTGDYVWLPAITLGVSHCGPFIVLLRNNMLDILGKGYIKAARARGLKETTVVIKHALRNAILPMLTKLGVTFGSMIGGSAIIESIFSWPGIGQLALNSIYNKDIPVIQGFMLLSATLIVLINLLVDIVYKAVDPQIKIT